VQKEQFLELLHNELLQRGIPPESARQYMQAITQSMSEKDIKEIEQIQNPSDVAKLAQGIAMIKQRTETVPSDASSPEAEDTALAAEKANDADSDDGTSDFISQSAAADDDVKVYLGASSLPQRQSPRETPAAASEAQEPAEVNYAEYIQDDELDNTATVRGKRIFWLIFFCSLPLILILAAVYFGLFGVLFAALCALIVLLVAALIGGSAVGAVVSLVGVIYGITQLITAASKAPGLYEIGLGLTIGGSVMAGGIIIYNIAVRLLPFLIRMLIALFSLCTGKLRTLFHMAKEACSKL